MRNSFGALVKGHLLSVHEHVLLRLLSATDQGQKWKRNSTRIGNDSGNHLSPMEPALPHWNRFMQVSLPDRFSVISNGPFDRYRSAPLSLNGPSDSKALHENGTPAASPMDCSPRSCTSSLASPLVLIQPAEAPR